MLFSKIHRARVSAADMDYEGSITIDKELMHAAKLKAGQQVDVANIANGARFTTYAIEGKEREICINGAAAHLAKPGDLVIIMAYASYSKKELKKYEPRVVLVDNENKITHIKKGV